MRNSIFSIVFTLFLISFLIPFSPVSSQEYVDTNSKLSVSLNSQTTFVYTDSEGYTVVVGLIENDDPLSFVTNVVIRANFFDDFNSNPLEITEGKTILNVIPPNDKSPFIIRSETPNIDISEASVLILDFDTSTSMKNSFIVSVNNVLLEPISSLSDSAYTLLFSGELQNGNIPISETSVYFAFYDVFERIIQISTLEIGDVEINEKISLDLIEKINPSAVGFLIFSESDNSYYPFVNVKIPLPQISTKSIIISDVVITDTLGNKLSEIKTDLTTKIKSKILIQFTNNISDETPYTYYVQIKESSSNVDIPPSIEYVGKYDGQFMGNTFELPSIDWVPEKKGLFFIETFIWDRNNVPCRSRAFCIVTCKLVDLFSKSIVNLYVYIFSYCYGWDF